MKGTYYMKVDRLVSMIMVLIEKKRVSAQELAEMFEVSPRTIYRDMDAINMAGIPVYAVPGVGGGFEIMQGYKLDKKIFSTTDLSAILMGLSSLTGMIKGEELVNAMAKIKSFMPADQVRKIELKANQILIDMSPWIGNRNIQPYLQMIQAAFQESRKLSFNYVDKHGNETMRTVEPYQLVLKNGYWYLQTYCYGRSDFRLFKISRISELCLKEERFVPQEYQAPQMNLNAIEEVKLQNIKIRIHVSVMDRVLDYCPFEHFVPDGEGYYIVSFPYIENEYYYDILLSFGEKCECLEPPHVRTKMKQKIQRIAALYD